MLGELKGTIWYSLLVALAALVFIIVVGVAIRTVFLEPQWQESYRFEVTSKLTDWCGANPDDPFNMQTLASLKANQEGEPDRFSKLPSSLQRSITAAIRGDREAACGF